MKLWGTVRRDNRIIRDAMEELPGLLPGQLENWDEAIGPLCRKMDLSRPVLLKKHARDLAEFNRAVFKQDDFMEEVDFDRFEIEVFTEKKK